MRTPTDEQRAIIDSLARIRVVQAVPGSGKTWLVAEVIRGEIERWQGETCGIAALSFTRVGGEEIRRAIGYELGHPHFVGTIDAFLFRYVVRPFLRPCFPSLASPRLIPGEWGAEHWSHWAPKEDAQTRGVPIFGCVFIGEDEGKKPIIAYRPGGSGSLTPLTGSVLECVRDGKKQLWQRSGCLSHSDAAFWASRILEDPTAGASVRAEIARRFPLLIVDELQDTGYYLGRSVLALAAEPSIRSLLVGDPDQAIFEFNGARPDLFANFTALPGAVVLPLSSSRRCPSRVAKAAEHVKDSGGVIQPAEEKQGKAILVTYGDLSGEVASIISAVSRVCRGEAKVLARGSNTVHELLGHRSVDPPALGCTALNHACRAVRLFRQGRQTASLAAASAAFETALLRHQGASDSKLIENGFDPAEWKEAVASFILAANAIPLSGTMLEWEQRAASLLDEHLSAFTAGKTAGFERGRLSPRKLRGWDKPAINFLPVESLAEDQKVPIVTVHAAKGETHDTTVFVCPDSSRADLCPSYVWWSNEAKKREERRIAYVAMTRARECLVLVVSDQCYERLRKLRPGFVSAFDRATIEELTVKLSVSEDGDSRPADAAPG